MRIYAYNLTGLAPKKDPFVTLDESHAPMMVILMLSVVLLSMASTAMSSSLKIADMRPSQHLFDQLLLLLLSHLILAL